MICRWKITKEDTFNDSRVKTLQKFGKLLNWRAEKHHHHKNERVITVRLKRKHTEIIIQSSCSNIQCLQAFTKFMQVKTRFSKFLIKSISAIAKTQPIYKWQRTTVQMPGKTNWKRMWETEHYGNVVLHNKSTAQKIQKNLQHCQCHADWAFLSPADNKI